MPEKDAAGFAVAVVVVGAVRAEKTVSDAQKAEREHEKVADRPEYGGPGCCKNGD
jgi:hypothetical protein